MRNEKKVGYINKKGIYVINPFEGYALDFSEGLAAVKVYREGWGYIDKEGNYFIKPQFYDARSFSEGLAAVQIGEKWGYIDNNGIYVVLPKFDKAWDFSQGLARVRLDGSSRWMIDKKGKLARPEYFKWLRKQER